MKPKQMSFLPRPVLEHGGIIRKGKRKLARPFDPKRPLHLVMRSTRARGQWSLLRTRNKARLLVLVHTIAKEKGVRLYQYSNSGNHLHLLVQARKRTDFQAFLRKLTGAIAMLITGARKGASVGRFWDALTYSRIVSWGREFETVQTYLLKNLLEGFGFVRSETNRLESLILREASTGPPS